MLSVVALLVLGVSLGAGQPPRKAPVVTRATTRVALAFDVGKRADRSFNQAANQGLLRATEELGVTSWVGDTTEGKSRAELVDAMLSQNADVIIGVGFLFGDDLAERAQKNPAQRFVCIDCRAPAGALPANYLVVSFRDDEGGFLAGALAGAASKSGQVGFVGGMDTAGTRRFLAGYGQGARHVRPDLRVVSVFAGTTPEAFVQPETGKKLGTDLFKGGSDVVFHAAGATGLGVIDAAKSEKKWAIGVDRDQEPEAPGAVLGSVVKRVDVAVFEAIREVKEKRFKSGVRDLGASNDGLVLAMSPSQQKLLDAAALQKLEAAQKDLREGRIVFP